MSNKIIISIVIGIIVVFAGVAFLKQGGTPTTVPKDSMSSAEPSQSTPSEPVAVMEPGTPPEVQPTPETPPTSSVAPQSAVITFTDSGYGPTPLTVKKGTTITFKNNSAGQMWPASAMHPTHAVYPTTGGCIGSTFDACQGIEPSGSWSFTFGVVGSWKYHDHLNPTRTGMVVVE